MIGWLSGVFITDWLMIRSLMLHKVHLLTCTCLFTHSEGSTQVRLLRAG